jgi:hypothetical protein
VSSMQNVSGNAQQFSSSSVLSSLVRRLPTSL